MFLTDLFYPQSTVGMAIWECGLENNSVVMQSIPLALLVLSMNDVAAPPPTFSSLGSGISFFADNLMLKKR